MESSTGVSPTDYLDRNLTETTSATAQLKVAAIAADQAGATSPVALEVTEQFGLSDIFFIVTGEVERNVLAIARDIEDSLNDAGVKTIRREGRETGRWVLLDFGDLIVHVFHEEERDYYQLERLWGDCPAIDLSEWINSSRETNS